MNCFCVTLSSAHDETHSQREGQAVWRCAPPVYALYGDTMEYIFQALALAWLVCLTAYTIAIIVHLGRYVFRERHNYHKNNVCQYCNNKRPGV